MKKLSLCFSFVALLVTLVGTVPAARAQDLNAVKARIAQRLPQLDEFKAQGVIGENNRGLTELRGGGVAAGDVVAAENRDRETVYAAIAKQNNTSADTVARARAKQIASGSASGVWVQHDDGTWAKK